jgi:L-malate glycosyltransferase
MRILATVTLNPNQLRSHLLPIVVLPEVEEVVLVADELPPPIPKVRGIVPSRRKRVALGRAGSKLLVCAQEAKRLEPDWILSYNVMPHGINGYAAGRLAGARTAYHMIGGHPEWSGGGWESDNAILRRLPRPIKPLERALLAVIRANDLVCTMGRSERERLIALGLDPRRVAVTPPSVDCNRFSPPPRGAERPYDLVTVGDLIPRKRLHDFIALVARLRAERPSIRGAIAGGGPLEHELRRAAIGAGVADAVDFLGVRTDIDDVYRAGRLFVLTSRHEGLSVAMTEALACGIPAIVSDVGDLRDLVDDGRNGHLVATGDIDAFARHAAELLRDESRWEAASAAARRAARERASVEAVSAIYRSMLVDPAPEEVDRAA